uniref:Uncharacterized protein n=1 Tax=Ixodes ricinus TaxID=34613 RepID=V5H8A9_IXORI
MMLLEYTAHGIPWLMGTCSLIWFVSDRDSEAFYVNLLLGPYTGSHSRRLASKAIARRRRPPARQKRNVRHSVDGHALLSFGYTCPASFFSPASCFTSPRSLAL